MRTVLILIVSLAIVALGFGIYWTMQKPDAPGTVTKNESAPSTRQATLPTANAQFIGPAQNVWYIHYDARTGRPTSRVRAQRYEPQKDERVLVIKPEAEFFSYEDNEITQVIRIVGESGYLTMQEGVSKNRNLPAGAPSSQSPRAGDMTDVTLYVLPGLDLPAEQANVTMTMPNASFDNELFRISTEAYKDDRGRTIARDQVPVKVRGEYEFDGRGLTIIYNQQYGRIDRLEIAHGKRLLIKKPGEFMKSGPTRKKKEEPKAMRWGDEMGDEGRLVVGPSPRPSPHPLDATRRNGIAWAGREREYGGLPMQGILLAAADSAAAIRAAASAEEPAKAPKDRVRAAAADPNAEAPVYRAIFKQNVRVLQGGKQVASAEEMQILFLQEEKEEAPATQPVKLAIAPAAMAVEVAAALMQPAAALPVSPKPAKAPTTRPVRKSPTTQPLGSEPVEVFWEGPLVIVPIIGARPERIAPGEAIVKFTGSAGHPVEVTRMENQVKTTLTCAALTHWTIDQGALLEEAAGLPVHMTDTRGTDITTHRMVFSDADATAQLFGASRAKMPLEEKDKEGRPQFMDVAWLNHCTLQFDPESGGDMTISAANLIGGVKVAHPELTLDSDTLNLQFDTEQQPATRPATTQPTTRPGQKAPPLKQLEARGSVKCQVNGPGGDKDKRSIAANALTLLTAHAPDGKLYARNLHAFGDVQAVDPERTLMAGVLTATLAEPEAKSTTRPTTRPKMDMAPGELQSMVAQDNVRIITADGKKAFADSLNIQKRGERTTVALHGRPARVVREKDSLSGDQITLIPETQELLVIGPGRMDGVQQDAPDQPQRPMELTWTRSLVGRGDTMEAEGSVYAKSIDADGSVNVARGNRMTMATTRPATTQPAVASKDGKAEKPTTPTTRPSGELDVMSNRIVQRLYLIGEAQTTSTLTSEKGELLRMFHVDSAEMRYHRRSEADQEFLIPGAGRLLFVDNRPPENTKEAKAAAEDPMGLRGKTGFVWQDQLLYQEKLNQIIMTGSVIVAREEVDPKGPERLYVMGDRIVADLVPPDPNAPKTRPATRPSTRPSFGLGGAMASKMQLKHVRVEGNVRVKSDKLNVEAATIDYEPATNVMVLRGSPGQPVRQFDANGVEQASFEEMTWDTKTSKITASKLRGAVNK